MTYFKSAFGWHFVEASEKRAYICKISQQEAYRIISTARGFDYGLVEQGINELEMGPHFLIQPESVMVVGKTGRELEPVSLECQVQANPAASYRWFKGRQPRTELTELLDSRYTLIGGKLIIRQPDEATDSDVYQCTAQNKFGTVVSDFAEISFGYLREFSNVQDAGTRAKAFDGATIECSEIQFKPEISYQWMKGDSKQFIRTQFQDYIFISNNGKLYFSEVSRNDEDEYHCLVTLTGGDRFSTGIDQPPMRTSLPISLIVDDQAPKIDWGPEIQDDFIAVFPKTPMRGQDVRLECFAYGSTTSAFVYSWSREDKPMPKSAQGLHHNRVLFLRDAQLEDSGVYRCTVSRGDQASDSKTIHLNLEAQPYLVSPLIDQHADIGSQITWICNAKGRPDPIYHWYKNGEKLTTQQDAYIKVRKNVLTIKQLSPDLHNGMYQCGAENSHGLVHSTAQLRVLAFAPAFTKSPPPTNLLAAEQGNVTLRCYPEGAPLPTIQWFKESYLIPEDESKFRILGNGNLLITFLSASDSGSYTCLATNMYGEANVTTFLNVTQRATITLSPPDTTTTINNTVFLVCEASCPKDIDLVYEWMFNGFPLDFNQAFYRQTQGGQPGTNGLYIINAQFDQEGQYTCTARTPFNAYSTSAYLSVYGTPRQPAGVSALSDTVTQNSTVVMWTQGFSSGGTVSAHVIQVSDEFDSQVWRDLLTVGVSDSYKSEDYTEGKHVTTASGLSPATGYQFRVIAVNEYGRGIPSDPSPYIQTLSAPPNGCPRNLRGGGGSVGDLTIRWDPLHKSEYGAASVGYKVYWRKKNIAAIDGVFRVETVLRAETDSLVRQVGAENYYLVYEVKIQAFNEMGVGPNSSLVEIYSAEDLPIAVPMNVKTSTYNSTAIEVSWDPVPDSRQYARGKVVGYQINYWMEEDDPDVNMRSIRYYGQVDNGLVIGLVENYNWIVDIQVPNFKAE